MSEKVSAFWPVQIGPFKYLFFVVNWNNFKNQITELLEKNLETLGETIGLEGKVVEAYKGALGETYQEVKAKEGWPYDVYARFDLEQYPFMLVLDSDFEEFDPRQDRWAVVWFSDFRDNPDSIPEIFGALVRKIQRGEDLFTYFQRLRTQQAAREFVGYFELRPGIFGVSVDVKAILADLGRAIHRRAP